MRMPLPNDWTVGDGLNTAGFRWRRRHEGTDSATGKDADTNRDHLTTRFDYQINANHKVSYTMSREEDWGVTGQTGLPDFPNGYFGKVRRTPDFHTVGLTSTLSQTVINELRLGLKRDTWFGTSPFHNGCCMDGKGEDDIDATSREAVASFPQIPGTSRLFYTQPGLSLGTYAPFSGVAAAPRFNTSPLGQLAETMSWIKGAHAFQGGFEFTRTGSSQRTTGGIGTAYPYATLGIGKNLHRSGRCGQLLEQAPMGESQHRYQLDFFRQNHECDRITNRHDQCSSGFLVRTKPWRMGTRAKAARLYTWLQLPVLL
ncbi:MAG: hypothetical protein DMG14_19765 [Acidobacteria bacterium]|nr:MAG: hypothetical protein DMG14_19765 [Acidobacteriota bacterium]